MRAAGDWPGKSSFQNFSKFLYVITLLALLSALVLISSTMTTLVAEQTSEIGIMKAVGGRRRQIAAVYLKTAVLLGGLATVAGIVLGAVLAYVLTRYFGSTFFAVGVGFGVDWPIVLASALVGLLGPPLAALPAIRRAVRVPVRDALEATGSAAGGQDAGDRLLRPRPLPAPPGADRAAQRRTAPAAQPVHRAGDRARRRHPARGVRPGHRGRQRQPRLVGGPRRGRQYRPGGLAACSTPAPRP